MSQQRSSSRDADSDVLPLSDLWMLVKKRMGACPSFFKLARGEPSLAWELFRLAEFAYLDNPIPSLFKEALFVYLS
ncbi:MAG: hypothetical protein L0H83_16285, partial [Salinisphaera sp.]|nr:hypothetical protein [Salinisphaera sp.]